MLDKDKTTKLNKQQSISVLFGRLETFATHYNANYCPKTQRKKRLKSDVLGTAKYLLSIYNTQIHRMAHFNNFEAIPPLRTNNYVIAKRLSKCKKTVYNHIERLVEAGVLLKVWRGSNTSYDLYFHHNIVALFEETTKKSVWKTPEKKYEEYIRKATENPVYDVNFTAYIPKWQQEYKEITTSVDKLPPLSPLPKAQEESKESLRDSFSHGKEHKKQERSLPPVLKAKSGDISPKEKKKVAPAAEINDKLQQQVDTCIRIFIKYAYFLLFSTDLLYDKKLERLMAVVAPYYINVTEETLENRHKMLIKRIDLVHKWLSYNPNKSLPDPEYYFNVNNTRGFTGSKKFYHTWQDQSSRYTAENFVQKEVDKYWRAVKKGETPTLEAYKRSEQRVSKHHPRYLPVFYAKVGHRLNKTA